MRAETNRGISPVCSNRNRTHAEEEPSDPMTCLNGLFVMLKLVRYQSKGPESSAGIAGRGKHFSVNG